MRFGRLVRHSLLAAFCLVPFLVGAEDWTRFRGPNGSGISPASGFPIELGPKNAAWRTPVRRGKSSPVLTERHVFLTAFEEGRLFTQCIDRRTGRLLWERAQERARVEFGNARNEPAAITPVTDGANVYAFFADFGFVAYDAAGNIRWQTPLGPFTNTMGLAASPVLAGEFVVVTVDGNEESFMAAFDRRDGKVRWKSRRDEKDGWATPVVYAEHSGGELIVTTSRGQLGAHRLADGARAWSYPRLSPAIVASPVLDRGVLYTFGYGQEEMTPFAQILGKYDKNGDGALGPDEYGTDALVTGVAAYEGNRDRIVTRDEWDGKQRRLLAPSSLLAVRLTADGSHELWRQERNFTGVVPSPLVYDGVVYVVKNGGILTAFDAATGAPSKTERIQAAVGGYSASPVAAEGRVYLASEDSKVSVVKGGRTWEVLAVNDLGEGCFATPALSRGEIYLRTTEALYCFRNRK